MHEAIEEKLIDLANAIRIPRYPFRRGPRELEVGKSLVGLDACHCLEEA
jgi:hypothetical protein